MELKQFNKIFFTLLIVHVALIFIEPESPLVAITKPTILLSLIGYYLQLGFKNMVYPQKLFVLGLIFSLIGDVLLIKDSLFIPGLISFLIAQISYTFAFYRSNFGKKGIIQKSTWIAAPILTYTLLLIYILKPKVGELLPAIVVYATVISLMLIAAINRIGVSKKTSAIFTITGALFFVASDTILAINKFHTPFIGAQELTMVTYGIAQYYLVRGLLDLSPDFTK